jgi:hypothetical protein
VSTAASEALPLNIGDQDDTLSAKESPAGTTTPGGEQKTQWKVVAKTAGLIPAQIIAERLKSEGIPARFWQEGAGRALGLVVGLLGTGHVIVPQSYVEQAEAILAKTETYPDEEE